MGAGAVGQPRCSRRAEWLAFGFALLVIGAISIVPVLVPHIRDDDRIDVSAVRRHIEAIASEPHAMGTPAIERVRSYILGELAQAGVLPETQLIDAPDYFDTSSGDSVEVVNILARVDGSTSTGAVLLMAHYDTVPSTPGANDNSMAVGNLIELVRVISGGPLLSNDVIVLFTDGEEPTPRYGATGFLNHPWADDVAVVFNLEAVGESGPSMVVEHEGPSWIISGYAAGVGSPAAFSFMTQTAELIGGATSDFDVFREAGVPGLNFATFRGSAIYHTPEDSPDRVSDDVIAHQGATAIGLVEYFGTSDLTEAAEGGELVFFTVGRNAMVHHATWWLTVGLMLSVIALAVLVWLRRKSSGLLLGRVAVDALVVFGGAVIAVVAGSGLWTLIVGQFPNLGIAASYIALAGIAVVVGGVAIAVLRRRLSRGGHDALLVAVLVLWLLLAVALVAGAPGAAYVFVWPGLAATVAALSMPVWRSRWAWVLGTSIVAAIALILLVPVIDTFFLLAGPRPGNPDSELPFVVGVSVACEYLVVMLIGATALAGESRSAARCAHPHHAGERTEGVHAGAGRS